MCINEADASPHIAGVLYRPLSEREALLFRQVLRDWRISQEEDTNTIVSLGGHTLIGDVLWVQGGLN